MAIKGLMRRLNEAGKIKIGCKGDEITSSKGTQFRPPKRLDHFIITTTEKDASNDFVEDADLMTALCSPNSDAALNDSGNIIGIPIQRAKSPMVPCVP